MRYLKVLGNNLVCWATATLIAAVVVSFSWSTVAALQADSISRFAEIFFFGVVIAFFSLCFGLSFALILVAPLHSFLVAHGRTSLGWAVAIALLPACIKWATQSENLITLGFMVYGATAGFLAHWLRVKDFFGLGSNNSFKPKPLRGSA